MTLILPEITTTNAAFWQGGKNGVLLITHCDECAHYIHPPSEFCITCGSRNVTPKSVSGEGEVVSFTINYQHWLPGLQTPYVVAIVTLPEQEGLRFVTNVIDCDPEAVFIGMQVMVKFQNHEDVWLPLFTPVKNEIKS